MIGWGDIRLGLAMLRELVGLGRDVDKSPGLSPKHVAVQNRASHGPFVPRALSPRAIDPSRVQRTQYCLACYRADGSVAHSCGLTK